MPSTHVDAVIIGAGPAGLASAAGLTGHGLKVTVLEKEARIAPAWHRHYDRLHLHTDRNHSGLPGLPMPRSYPRYPSRTQVIDYLEAYANHFGLQPIFRSNLANERMAPLAGCTPEGLAHDLAEHVASWPFATKVDALKNRTALIVTSDDGLANETNTFAAALRKAGDSHVSTVHLPTDHSYSDQRIELSKAVLAWLASLPR